jgi:predicted RNA-binding protein YlxR (DUF448 family)
MTMPLSHFVGGNLWVLKTTAMNRGRGIYVFKSMKQLRQIIKQFINDHKPNAGNNELIQGTYGFNSGQIKDK